MKRLWTIAAFSILCLIMNTWAAEQPVNLAGSWILDSKNSDPFPHPVNNLNSGMSMPAGGMSGGTAGGGTAGGGRGRGMPRGDTPDPEGGNMPQTGRGPQPGSGALPMVIEQKESELRIIRTMKVMGKEMPLIEKYICDGVERTEMVPVAGSADQAKVVTKATWKKSKLQVRTRARYPKSSEVEIKKEFAISEDGKTLKVKTSNMTLMGIMIQDQIYYRQ